MYRERILTDKLQKLVASFPAVVVSGARQVGKTTLLRHVFPDYDYAVFDPSIDLENARSEPDLFLRNAHRDLRIGAGAVLCAVDRPRWITEDTSALPWNTL
jgi:hypothetical protein